MPQKERTKKPDVQILIEPWKPKSREMPFCMIVFHNQSDKQLPSLCLLPKEQDGRLYFAKGHRDSGGLRLDTKTHMITTALPEMLRLLYPWQGEYELSSGQDGPFVQRPDGKTPELDVKDMMADMGLTGENVPATIVDNFVETVDKSGQEPETPAVPEQPPDAPEQKQGGQSPINSPPDNGHGRKSAKQAKSPAKPPEPQPKACESPVPEPAPAAEPSRNTACARTSEQMAKLVTMRVLAKRLTRQIDPANEKAAATAAVLLQLIEEEI